jgi:hypothetical protein
METSGNYRGVYEASGVTELQLSNATPKEFAAQIEPLDRDLEAMKNGLAYSKSC